MVKINRIIESCGDRDRGHRGSEIQVVRRECILEPTETILIIIIKYRV